MSKKQHEQNTVVADMSKEGVTFTPRAAQRISQLPETSFQKIPRKTHHNEGEPQNNDRRN